MDHSSRDSLDEIFEMQRSFATPVKNNGYPDGMEAMVSILCTAIIQEAVELQRTTNWKWWKTPVAFDITHAREEIINILHLVIQTAIEMGLGPRDILTEYRRKNEINKERQRNGY